MSTPPDPNPFGGNGRPTLSARAAKLVRILVVSGVLFIVAGVIAGVAVDPVLFALAAAGIFDLVFAWLVSTGKIAVT